jgi:pimeloyl-ACP methyl ester carboxylesterase
MKLVKTYANFIALLLITNLSLGQTSNSIKYGNNKEAGNFKKINGINLYYEIYGTGKPLILLHGNGGSIRSQQGKIKFFSKQYQVIAIDSRSHGKSIDSLTDLTYVQMAEDVRVLMDSLKIESATIFGQSDGGIIGLLLAIRYPKRVSKLATFGANIFPGKKAIFDEIDDMVKDSIKSTKDKNTLKLNLLLAHQPNITTKDLQKIECPVLIMSGDRDAIRLEYSIKIFNAIKNSNFFVMPGATHGDSWEKPDLFNLILSDFLEKPFSTLTTFEAFKKYK